MSLVKFIQGTQDKIESSEIQEGTIYFATDLGDVAYDLNGKRTWVANKQLSTTDWVSNDLKVPTTKAVDQRIADISPKQIEWATGTETNAQLYAYYKDGKCVLYGSGKSIYMLTDCSTSASIFMRLNVATWMNQGGSLYMSRIQVDSWRVQSDVWIHSEVEDIQKISDKLKSTDTWSSSDDKYPTTKAIEAYVAANAPTPNLTGYEQTANKETTLTTTSNVKFPTSKAVADYVSNQIPDISGKENSSNKETTLTATSDTKYPTSKAVATYVSGKENSSNKETTLTATSDTKYPTSKAVATYVSNQIPDISGKENSSNKETTLTATSDTKYPTSKAVATYVSSKIPNVSGYEQTSNKQSSTATWTANNNKYPTTAAVDARITAAINGAIESIMNDTY